MLGQAAGLGEPFAEDLGGGFVAIDCDFGKSAGTFDLEHGLRPGGAEGIWAGELD